MSSESDRVAFDDSVQPHDETVLFQDKKWTYIVDSTSNGGNFSSQIQFDLNTLSSQSQWVDLSQAYVNFPIRVKIRNAGGSAATTTVSTPETLAVLKNGFHQMIDSVQLVVDGQTIQTSQIFENIAANFRVLSTWSEDTLQKYGPTLGVALDNYAGIDNVAASTLIPSTWGIDIVAGDNTALTARRSVQNVRATGTGAVSTILGQQAKNLGKSQVAVAGAGSIAAGAHVYTQFVMATIRLADICPAVKAMPMTRNLKGFLYLNYNSSTTTLQYNATPALTSVSTVSQFGRCAPVLYNNDQTAPLSVANATWELECTVSGVQTDQTAAAPQLTFARLVCPYYVANPTVDSALSMKKTYRYLERNVSTFDITAGANTTITLSPGISNPKGVLLFPYFTGSSTVSNLVSNPLLSVVDTCPSTTSPFAALKDLQIMIANKPIFNNPVQYDADLFLQEVAQLGLDGGLNNEMSSGLLSAQDWDQLYRYYYVNVGRRIESEDGSSKSVMAQCTNATQCNMRVIAMIFYEKEITIDTSMGRVYQGRA